MFDRFATALIVLGTVAAAPMAARAQENSIMQSFHPEKAAAAKPAGADHDAAKAEADRSGATARPADHASKAAGGTGR